MKQQKKWLGSESPSKSFICVIPNRRKINKWHSFNGSTIRPRYEEFDLISQAILVSVNVMIQEKMAIKDCRVIMENRMHKK